MKDLRAVATAQGFATKPFIVTEGSPSLTYKTNTVRDADTKAKIMQRYMLFSLFADPYVYASCIYAADNGGMGWTATDVAAWNAMRTHLLSGTITEVLLKTNGVITVKVNGVVMEF